MDSKFGVSNINYCRLCASTNDDPLNIFSEIGIELQMREIISEHFQCDVSETDALSNFVCLKCWSMTESFHQLYQNAKEVQQRFFNQVVKAESDSSEIWIDNTCREDIDQPEYSDTINSIKVEPNNSNEEPTEITANDDKHRATESMLSFAEGGESKNVSKQMPSSKKKKVEFEKLFLENKHRFDMSCDACPTSFDTLDEARNHYAVDHNNPRGYIKCCNVKLIYRCKVVKHLSRHLEPDRFRCKECCKVYSAMHVLKAHMKLHNENEGEKELVVCDICKKAFTSKLYLKKHLQWHSEGNTSDNEQYRQFIADNFDMKCDMCDSVFSTFHDARRHYKDLHNEKKGYVKCCSKKLNEFWLVIDHINAEHLNPKIFKCQLCDKDYADRKKFYLHQRRHKQAITKPFICDYCGKNFRNKETITRHFYTRHVDSEPKFECKTCHKRFQLVSLLRNHYYSVHREKTANVTCEICGKSFSVKANFEKHMLSHTDKSERLSQRKQCQHCGEWLLTKSGIYYHEKIHTSGVQKCGQCQTELKNKLALLAHVRKYHREPKYKCNYCHKTFEISSKLKEHEEGHTRHKIYPCQYCSKTFSVQSSRQTHVRRTHPAELKLKKEMRKQLDTPIDANPSQNI